MKAGEKFAIVRHGSLRLAADQTAFVYDAKQVLGQFEATNVDEALCEGKLESASFFDRINPDDEVVRAIPTPQPPEGRAPAAQPADNRPLLRRLLGL